MTTPTPLEEALASLFAASWARRPEDRAVTGLGVSVRSGAVQSVSWVIARPPAESGDVYWRSYGVDAATYARICQGAERSPMAMCDLDEAATEILDGLRLRFPAGDAAVLEVCVQGLLRARAEGGLAGAFVTIWRGSGWGAADEALVCRLG